MDWIFAVAIAVVAWIALRGRNPGLFGGGGGDAGTGSFNNYPSSDQYGRIDDVSNALDNIGQAIFQFEGGKPGNVNVTHNNPGNIEQGGQIIRYPDIGDGWDALNAYITKHVTEHPDWDFYDFFAYYLRGSTTAPTKDAQGDSDAYAEYVANYLGVDPSTPVSQVMAGG